MRGAHDVRNGVEAGLAKRAVVSREVLAIVIGAVVYATVVGSDQDEILLTGTADVDIRVIGEAMGDVLRRA